MARMDKPSLEIEIGLFDSKSVQVLEELGQELTHTFDNVQIHRTRTEMEVSVLDDLKHPTHASKYWQAMREQNAMFTGVTLLSFDYREEVIKVKMLEKKLFTEEDKLKKELLKIKIDRKHFYLNDMKRSARHKIREIQAWSEIKNREAEKMTKEELENVNNHQLESYTKRWMNQADVMGDNGSPAERQNLLGQLHTGIKWCKDSGLLSQEVING